jgi:uncharacterized protein
MILIIIIYTIWDNNRITIAKQKVVMKDLPEQLEGFTILQVSDLHEKEFGKNQKRLIHKINSLSYDAIVFTGDMLDGTDSKNYDAFYSLIEGIKNKQYAYYVAGNTDPLNYEVGQTVEKSEFIKGMEKRGVQLLESIDSIVIEGKKIQFTYFELAILKDPNYMDTIEGIIHLPYASNELYKQYQAKLWKDLMGKMDGDVIVALNHYPVTDGRLDFLEQDYRTELPPIDIILAGHYHGGQIRLPFIGAVFVPEVWYNYSLFPPQDRVKGLWEHKGIQQYVSTGLGSSDAVSFLKFRFLNPPEINLITFTS